MALDTAKLHEVLQDIAAGRLQLPDFQREWKWNDERIRALLATVVLDYPLGVVMTLATGGKPPFKARPLAGADATTGAVDRLLLDGQQRLTSLFQALYLDQPVQTLDAANKRTKLWYYIDIAAAVRPDADREDAILSVPEDRVLRSDFGRQVELDLSDGTKEAEHGCFPLNIALDPQRYGRWQQAYVTRHGQSGWDTWHRFDELVLSRIKSFDIPMISLPEKTTKDAVCAVFERVNTGGVQLNVFELLTATYAGDQTYFDEHGDDFNLGQEWRTVKQELSKVNLALGDAGTTEETGVTSTDFLQAICLVRSYQFMVDGHPSAGVSCKRKDLLNLPLEDFRRLAPLVARGFAWVGEFLARQFIIHHTDLPYRTQLIPLAAAHAVRAEQGGFTPADEEAIARWYWCGVLGEMYGGGTESRMARDVEQLLAALADPSVVPDTVAESGFRADRLARLTTRNSAAYKGVYALVAKSGAYDWYFTDAPLSKEVILAQNVDVRQIFPKAWFARNRKNDERAKSIVNKTLLSYRAASFTTGAPSTYVPYLARESGLDSVWFDDRIASHRIDPALLRADDFDAFFADRSERLLALIERVMGKPVIRPQAEAATGADDAH